MTQVMLRRWLGVVLAALALAVPVRAEEARPAPQPYVVLVGINKYADKQIKERPLAEADAKALYDLFTDKKYLGADARHVRLLLGTPDATRPSEPATRENILKALRWVADKAGPNDLVLFAFIGQGGPLGDSGDRLCYFASDSTFKGRDKDAVAAGEIGDALKNLQSRRFCALLDVNFKGFTSPGGPQAIAEPTLGKAPYSEFLGDDGTEEHAPKPGRVVFLATLGLSTSLDLKEHGLFTQAVLDGLRGAADKEGYEADGVVTVDELTKYLDKEIPHRAGQFGKTREEKEQSHFILGGRGSHFVLTTDPAVSAKVRQRLEKWGQMVKDQKVPAPIATEGKELLERMPRLEARRSLRKEYQKLVDGQIDFDRFTTRRQEILDGTKMAREDAKVFAQMVMDAIDIVAENYVKEVKPGDLVAWAVRGLYRRAEEKVPVRIEDRLKKAAELRKRDLLDLLTDARQALGKREDLDKHKDIDITLQRMLVHLDPYTTYIDPVMLDKFRQEVQGTFTGIGIQIRKDSTTDQLLVVTPIKDSPAYKAGLQAGDIITTIQRDVDSKGKRLDSTRVTPTKGLALNEAVNIIKGQPRTDVTLTVKREGADKPIDIRVTRARIVVESVLGYKRTSNDDWDYWIDREGKIGYVRLTNFATNSYDDLYRVMKDLTEQGVKGFILDLRFNPGGLLTSAVKITDLFIDDGLIVSIRPRFGREQRFPGHHAGSLLDFPMVCLVNGYSASGSEIVAAALQDHHRALIVGERSYGKGSVQNIQPFEGGELKLTTASFWRPHGENLNKSSTTGKDEDEWGVKPHKVVKLTSKEREELAEHQRDAEIIQRPGQPPKARKSAFKDRQLEAALEYLHGQIKTALRAPAKKAG